MKNLILSILLLLPITSRADSCPTLAGIFAGDCERTQAGEVNRVNLLIYLLQFDCDKFIFNQVGVEEYYTLGPGTVYKTNHYIKHRRAIYSGNTLNLVEFATNLNGANARILRSQFKINDDGTGEYESDCVNFPSGEVTSTYACQKMKYSSR